MPNLDFLIAEWDVLAQAPATFFVFGVIACSVGWIARGFVFGQRLENLKSEIRLLERQNGVRIDSVKADSGHSSSEEVAELKARLASMEPLVLSDHQVEVVLSILKRSRRSILITRAVGATNVDAAYRQMQDIFTKAGWNVDAHVVLANERLDNSGRNVLVRGDINDASLSALRDAFGRAGIDFKEEEKPSDENITVPQLLFTAPWVPARWG